MQGESFGRYLKRVYKESGIIGQLILVNTLVYVFLLVIQIVGKLYLKPDLLDNVLPFLGASSDLSVLARHPWTIVTHFFTHYQFFHFLLNMMVLYFSSRLFLLYFSERKLIITYFLGGIFAYFIHVAASNAFPLMAADGSNNLVGASASIMAIFFAIAIHQPGLKVNLFGILPVPLLAIAALFLLSDLIGIGTGDKVARFGHLGGALFGMITVIQANKYGSFMNRLDRFFGKFNFKRKSPRNKSKLRVTSYQAPPATKLTDEEYNATKAERQRRVDAILEKISVKGYEGLTKEEKDILFNESQR